MFVELRCQREVKGVGEVGVKTGEIASGTYNHGQIISQSSPSSLKGRYILSW